MNDDRDDLDVVRGIVYGCLLAVPFWLAMLAVLP